MIKELDINKIKFLPISRENLVLSLDRLTRFKYPEKKYYRFFSDILCRYLLYPKFSKNEILQMSTDVLKKIAERLWNESVKEYVKDSEPDTQFNKILLKEMFSTYHLSESLKELVDIKININGVLTIARNICGYEELPLNIKRLVMLKKHNFADEISLRERYNLLFPIEKIVLCEGITEEILLPAFAKLYGYDFLKYGVKLVGAGGKNQVVKLYSKLRNELKIPIFILLDADAAAAADLISPILRDKDVIYLIKHGEFEDIFSLNLIKRTINNRYKNICESSVADFKQNLPMTRILSEFFRIHELGDFQKAEFAKELADNLKYKTDLTEETEQILLQIQTLH